VGNISRGVLALLRRLLGIAIIVVVSTVASLLALEAGLRIWDGVPIFSTENFVARDLDAIHKTGSPAIYDSSLGWTPTPNLVLGGDGIEEYTSGELGIRMSSRQIVPLQQGATLLVGDSFGSGAEVDDAYSWPAQLERIVGTPVINAAVGGYGFDQIVLRAESLLPILKPRTVLVQTRLEFGLSVARMSVYGGTPKPYFRIEDGRLTLQNQPVPRLASSSDDIGWERSAFGHSYLVHYVVTRLDLLQWWVSPSMAIKFALSPDEAVDVTCLLMQRLAQMRDREGIKVAVVLEYAGPDGLESKLTWDGDRDRVLACARRERLDIVDVLEALRSTYRRDDLAQPAGR
jgi:hypothetical protein